MVNNDRIYEAFIGDLGKELQFQMDERVQWIIDQTEQFGERVLDVGCSQGIISLLLARTGKQVFGIDIEQESIDFAQSLLLDSPYSDLKDKVSFSCINFLEYDDTEKFDCIIIAEVLEHLTDPAKFLEKANALLDEEGVLVVTVPFGVSDHPNHSRTYYMSDIYDLISSYFKIHSLDFMGSWMAITACSLNNNIEAFLVSQDANKRQELNFLDIHRELVLEKQNLQQLNNEYAASLSDLANDFDSEIIYLKTLKKYILKLETQNQYLKIENAEYERKLSKILDTWYGKIAIKLYYFLKKMITKVKNIVKKGK